MSADSDHRRAQSLVRELCDEFPHPDTGKALPGLLSQAWDAKPQTLTLRQPEASEGGQTGKPGSRPPTRLDLWAHVQRCLDWARTEADELGLYTNGADGEKALRKLPDLIWNTLDDCDDCDACLHPLDRETYRCTLCRDDKFQPVKHVCSCRHRKLCRSIAYYHSELRTALRFQEPKRDLRGAQCPECGSRKISVRADDERIWCREEACDWERRGRFAIIAEAS